MGASGDVFFCQDITCSSILKFGLEYLLYYKAPLASLASD